MVKAFALLVAGASAMSFDEYKQQFGKVYNGDESERKAIFESNKASWGEHESGAVLGATQFSDMTLEEFQAMPIRGLATGLMADLPYLGAHEITPMLIPLQPSTGCLRVLSPQSRTRANADLAGPSPPLAVSKVLGRSPLAALSACLSSSSSIAPSRTVDATEA